VKYLLLALISFITLADERGKAIYTTKCISCHNANPDKKGSIGPAIDDSTATLIILKTQYKKYPKGYKPKRKTNIMPKIPLSDKQLYYLYEYISDFRRNK
jgi:mono/diheme cytochrome c family protein